MVRRVHTGEQAEGSPGGKLISPSASRNLAPIQDVLRRYLPAQGSALEIASGSGEHIVAHARAFPGLIWQPSDPDAERLASIGVWQAEASLPNLRAALALDACRPGWAAVEGPRDVILLVNLLHLISDGEVAVLLDEVARAIAPGGVFLVYGPFLRNGVATSDGDASFNASLRAQDPAIGYKDVDQIANILEALQLRVTTHSMPANNVMMAARRS